MLGKRKTTELLPEQMKRTIKQDSLMLALPSELTVRGISDSDPACSWFIVSPSSISAQLSPTLLSKEWG